MSSIPLEGPVSKIAEQTISKLNEIRLFLEIKYSIHIIDAAEIVPYIQK